MRKVATVAVASATVWLGLLPLAQGHGDNNTGVGVHNPMSGNNHNVSISSTSRSYTDIPSYFHAKNQSNMLLAHIVLMTIAWAFMLPIAIMLSIARSHFHLLAQIVFFITNAAGILLSIVYTHQMPDLYENEKHSPTGWVTSTIAAIWVVVSFITTYGNRRDRYHLLDQIKASGPTSRFQHFNHRASADGNCRFAGRSTETLQNPPQSQSPYSHHREGLRYDSDGTEDDTDDIEKLSLLRRSRVSRLVSRNIDILLSFKRTLNAIAILKTVLDRTMLLLGFICIATGAVVYGGIFHGKSVFNGLAHFIKGSVFFWYGLLTFGRWLGCFAEFGWAWNKKPSEEIVGRRIAMVPSAEFLESALICFYGVSNVWLEHLSNSGGEWSATDLEHVSITLMFFGGGLLGMLIESSAVRSLVANMLLVKQERPLGASEPPCDEMSDGTQQRGISLNPVPALIIFLLGLTMGSHHQASMVSTMLHAQWGSLFMGAAIARTATYVLFYLKHSVSHFPQRPPTEIITSFCLVAGGLLLMLSNKDTVGALEHNSLDAMFVFNVVVGVTAFLMAWATVCLGVKGWVGRREAVNGLNSRGH